MSVLLCLVVAVVVYKTSVEVVWQKHECGLLTRSQVARTTATTQHTARDLGTSSADDDIDQTTGDRVPDTDRAAFSHYVR